MTTTAATHFALRDVVKEALIGIVDRAHRAVMTISAIVLGIASFTVVVGLSDSAGGSVSDSFAIQKATQVSIVDQTPTDEVGGYGFPADSISRVSTLNGVQSASISWAVGADNLPVANSPSDAATTARLEVRAATPGYAATLGATISSGRFLNTFDELNATSACVLGRGAAAQLGVTDVGRTIWIGGAPYTVVGFISDIDRDPGSLSSAFIATSSARQRFGQPTVIRPARMVVRTQTGAAQQVGAEAPLALRPDAPDLMRVDAVAAGSVLESKVSNTLATLFWVLGAVLLVVAGIGIANTAIVSVVERRYEIGLRRCMGGQRRHIVLQVVIENAVLGGLGSLLGGTLGNAVVIVVDAASGWTALLRPAVTFGAPLAGLVIGAAAGIYPAILAGRMQPVDVMRA